MKIPWLIDLGFVVGCVIVMAVLICLSPVLVPVIIWFAVRDA